MAAIPQIQTPIQLVATPPPPPPSRTRTTSISFRTAAHNNVTSANAIATTTRVVVADRLSNQATPWLMLPPEVDDITGDKLERFYSLTDGQTVRLNRKKSLKVPDTAKCFASTLGSWLGYADTKDGSLYLSNPFLSDIVELPSLGTLPRVVGVESDPKSGSIINFKVDMPDYVTTWDECAGDSYSLIDPVSMADTMISNLALSFDDPRYPECVAMAIQGEMSRLAYCHIGKQFHPTYRKPLGCNMNDGTFWSGLQEDFFPGCCSSNQVVYSSKNNVFYTLFDDTGIQSFDVERDRGRRTKKVSQFRMEDLEQQLDHEFEDEQGSEALKELRRMCKTKYYLVTLENGDLLLIVRHYSPVEWESGYIPPYNTIHFDVFRVSYPRKLERVSYLEDRAIFIGSNQSFCVKTGASPGCWKRGKY